MKKRLSSHVLAMIAALCIVFSACTKQQANQEMSADTQLSGKDDGSEVELDGFPLTKSQQDEVDQYEKQQPEAESGCTYNRYVSVPRARIATVRNPNTPAAVSGPCAKYLVVVKYYSGGQEASSYSFKLGPGDKRTFNTCSPGSPFGSVGLTVYYRNSVKVPRTSTSKCN